MHVAIVGTGIAGLVAARALHPRHELTIFEANDHVGGHTNTVEVDVPEGRLPVDTGFIVFNHRTYPRFCRLLDALGVASQPSDMSFSVRCERTDLEWAATSLDAVFAQRRNLLRPGFYRMLRDVLRFNREAVTLAQQGAHDLTMGTLLERGGFSEAFARYYLEPMGAAIWSRAPGAMADFPARFFVRFFHNHGLLSLADQPHWRTIAGGAREYVTPLVAPFRDHIRLRSPVRRVQRDAHGVHIATDAGTERFDAVVLALHSDQALRILADPSPAERHILGAIPYQANQAVLHTDASVMPRRRRAWASWNYTIAAAPTDHATLTYHMNRLQRLPTRTDLFVTLNPTVPIAEHHVRRRLAYDHPIFGPTTDAIQARRSEISGVRRTAYCGAYWRYGFHEDGVVSGLAAAAEIEAAVKQSDTATARAA